MQYAQFQNNTMELNIIFWRCKNPITFGYGCAKMAAALNKGFCLHKYISVVIIILGMSWESCYIIHAQLQYVYNFIDLLRFQIVHKLRYGLLAMLVSHACHACLPCLSATVCCDCCRCKIWRTSMISLYCVWICHVYNGRRHAIKTRKFCYSNYNYTRCMGLVLYYTITYTVKSLI